MGFNGKAFLLGFLPPGWTGRDRIAGPATADGGLGKVKGGCTLLKSVTFGLDLDFNLDGPRKDFLAAPITPWKDWTG